MLKTPLNFYDGMYLKREDLQVFNTIKTRTAKGLVEFAERKGLLDPNGGRKDFVVASSGNAAVALAYFAQARGYTCHAYMRPDVSESKKKRLMSAKAVIWYHKDFVGEARRVAEANGWALLDQHGWEANARVHYETTMPEIMAQLRDLKGYVEPRDVTVFSSVGTGGTILGAQMAGMHVVGVQPDGSVFDDPEAKPRERTFANWGYGQTSWKTLFSPKRSEGIPIVTVSLGSG